MKKNVVFLVTLHVMSLLLIVHCSLLIAQAPPPALNQSDFPANGNSLRSDPFNIPVAVTFNPNNLTPQDTVSIDRSVLKALNKLGDTSFNTIGDQNAYHHWYLSLPLYNSYKTQVAFHHYQTPGSGTPGFSRFKGANLYYQVDSTLYFFENNSTGYNSLGYYTLAKSEIQNVSLPQVTYPITYNTPVNVKHTKVKSTYLSDGSSIPMNSSVDTEIQGYGKIDIDKGDGTSLTYDSCFLVVNHEMDSLDLSSIMGSTAWEWDEIKTYNIYSPRFPEPLVSFQYIKSRNDLYSYWAMYPSFAWNDYFTMNYISLNMKSVTCNGFSVSANSSDATCSNCSDGDASINITGGIPPYSIQWSYSQTVNNTVNDIGIPSGNYYVFVYDSNGCLAYTTFNVGISCGLQLYVGVTNASCDTCHNGAATAYAYDGNEPYTWKWNTTPVQTTQSISGLLTGTYSVCVTDAKGCTACDQSVFIDSTNCNNFWITVHYKNPTCSTCPDGYAWVQPSGGTPPFSYSWDTDPVQTTDTAKGLKQGMFHVCVTDFYGCKRCYDSVFVDAALCSAYFELYSTSTPHVYNAVNMAYGAKPLKYLWSWGDGNTDTTEYPSHTYDSTGFYKICLTITDANGCNSNYCTSFYLMKSGNPMITIHVVSSNAGIQALNSSSTGDFNIYPNPASDNITIDYQAVGTQNFVSSTLIKLYSITGQLLKSKLIQSEKTAINISDLPGGVYVIKVSNDNNIAVKRIVKD